MQAISALVIEIFSSLTIIGLILILVLIIVILVPRLQPKHKSFKKLTNFLSDNYIALVLIVTGISTFGSLVFSIFLNFPPCELCWYQRIAMYPQTLIAGVALLTNEIEIKKYIVPMSVIGALIALYHTIMQMFPNALQCSDEVVKCNIKQFSGFGFVTIPMMALTAFLLVLLFSIASWKREK